MSPLNWLQDTLRNWLAVEEKPRQPVLTVLVYTQRGTELQDHYVIGANGIYLTGVPLATQQKGMRLLSREQVTEPEKFDQLWKEITGADLVWEEDQQ